MANEKNPISVIKIWCPHSRKHLGLGLVPQRCTFKGLSKEFEDTGIEVCWQTSLRCKWLSSVEKLCQLWGFLVGRKGAELSSVIEGISVTFVPPFAEGSAHTNFYFKISDTFLATNAILFMLTALPLN